MGIKLIAVLLISIAVVTVGIVIAAFESKKPRVIAILLLAATAVSSSMYMKTKILVIKQEQLGGNYVRFLED